MQHHHQTPGEGSFMQLWPLDILLITMGLAVIYLAAAGANHEQKQVAKRASVSARVYFLSGLLIFYIAQGTPLAYYGHHYSFSLHMLQQSLMFFLVSPLILLGLPDQVLWFLARHRQLGPIIEFMTKPLLSVVAFNMLFSLYHLPVIFDVLHNHPLMLSSYHFMLQITSFCMWWTVLCPPRNGQGLSHIKKIAYMFANGVLLTPACALIIFADHLLYASYQTTLPFFDFFTPLEDQQLGGVLMKLIQEIVYATVIGLIFYQWYRMENGRDSDILSDERM